MKPYLERKSLLFVLLLTALFISFFFMEEAGQETGNVNANYRSFTDTDSLQAYMKWHPDREPLSSAHRGGPMAVFPENALETFENILSFGPCLIECYVRMTADGHLVMMHDSTLEWTSTGKGKVLAAARGRQVYSELYKHGADILSTDNIPLVSRAISEIGKRDYIKK